MKKGELKGGKIATPIREMLASDVYNGVIFHCDSVEAAEVTRITALVLRGRNNYEYKTSRRGDDLIVYTNFDIFEDESCFFEVNNRRADL